MGRAVGLLDERACRWQLERFGGGCVNALNAILGLEPVPECPAVSTVHLFRCLVGVGGRVAYWRPLSNMLPNRRCPIDRTSGGA
jgi:hypothetical protein